MAQLQAPVRDPAQRILTVPNLFTVVRLACVPVFLWLLFGAEDRVAAAVLLAVLGATDWVDGYIARHFHQTSVVGTVLDPVADRILLGTAVVALVVDGSVPFWVGALVLAREVAVAAMTLVFMAAGAARIEVRWVGKAGAFALMFALPLFCLAAGIGTASGVVRTAAWICALVGLALSYLAALEYLPRWIQALHEGRAARRAVADPATPLVLPVSTSGVGTDSGARRRDPPQPAGPRSAESPPVRPPSSPRAVP